MRNILIILLVAMGFWGCRESYSVDANLPSRGYLVVEGMINSGAGSTTLRLSRTNALTDTVLQMENNATVNVQDEQLNNYPLSPISNGYYHSSGLNLNPNNRYRLHIISNGKEYESDFVQVHSNPPVDSISWVRTPDGVQVFANAKDVTNSTRYYYWQYEETWEYHAVYAPDCKYVVTQGPDGQPIYTVDFINPALNTTTDSSLFKCWSSNSSYDFLMASTIKYALDTVSMPIRFIPNDAVELGVLYHIRVNQYGLSKEAYEFLQKMKRNSDQLGTVFDAQPTELVGNIRCVNNPNEMVVGFVMACPIQEKSIFISRSEVTDWNFPPACPLEDQNNISSEIRSKNVSDDGKVFIKLPVHWTFKSPLPAPYGSITQFQAARAECVDCRMWGGSTTKPIFWP